MMQPQTVQSPGCIAIGKYVDTIPLYSITYFLKQSMYFERKFKMWYIIETNLIKSVDLLMSTRSYTIDQMYKLAFVDSMTGTYNRNMLEELRGFFNTFEGYVSIVDIDGLKSINDTYGHHNGDSLIKSVAKRLKSVSECVFRLGGDEFLLITKSDIKLEDHRISVGCIRKPNHISLSHAMREADRMMYVMKNTRMVRCAQ